MIKRLVVLLLVAGTLLAFEDVSFSARSLGLGGEHSAVAEDAFCMITNPALPARYKRAVVSICAAPYIHRRFYWTASYAQPVPGLGVIGASLLYYNRPNPFVSIRTGEADVRFFVAFPLGRYFSLGATVGNHSRWDADHYHDSFEDRFEQGPFLSLGTWLTHPNGLNLALSVTEANPVSFASSVSHFGISWSPDFKNPLILSSLVLAGDGGFRFSDDVIKIHLGGEAWLLKNHLGLRAGMRYGTDQLSEFSPTLGASIRTHRVEKTDFELHYGVAFNYSHGSYGAFFDNGLADSTMILHQLSLSVLFGDARKAEKDSILAAQTERARRLREEALARERDRLRAELENINKERAVLARERADIERVRQEALGAVGRIKGLLIQDTDSLIRITLTEEALCFEPGSAQIPFPEGYRVLARIGDFLADYPGKVLRVLRVEAHTDNVALTEEQRGAYKDNQALSEARAEMVRSYFINVEGIRANLITAKGLGSKEPLAPNDTEEGRAQNRRIVISVLKR